MCAFQCPVSTQLIRLSLMGKIRAVKKFWHYVSYL